MSRLDALYLRSPLWLQNASVAAYGWWWHRRRFGEHYRHLVRELIEHERWTSEEIERYQGSRLDEVLRAALQSPYYRPLVEQAGVSSAMRLRDALAGLPLLSKQQLRTSSKALLTGRAPRGTITFKSSGTTGTPTEIFYTRQFHAVEVAVIEARNLRWAGATYRERRVMFGARKICRFDQDQPPFWRFSPAENLAYASVYHLTPKFLPAYIRFLRSFKPVVVMGYPSALYAVAQFALAHNEVLPAATGVFTSAERVEDHMRDVIERAWQTRLFDRYGAVEGCVSASQCEHGRYHVNPEVGIVEILDGQGRPVGPGVDGEVVCTGLQNLLQPLIRYRIGDTARWATDQTCPCGRQFPILDGINGRVEDVCYTADGRQIVRFDTVFKGVDRIREAQVIQDAIDAFRVDVVPAGGFNADDVKLIAQNLRVHVGNVGVKVECVPSIPRTAAGKFRAVICRLSPEEKDRLGGVTSQSREAVLARPVD